jgi:transcriptional regulator with XRE-family HTH domain
LLHSVAALTDERNRLPIQTQAELESALGENLRALRLDRNIDQKTLAERAGISVRAVKNLEGGLGSTLKSLVAVLRALDREDWLKTIAPVATINPLTMTRGAQPRQRARRRAAPHGD